MPKDEFDFDDPLELNGVGLVCEEDTTEAMTECFIEEFMRLGHNPKQILAMFRNPHYLGMNLVVQKRGEQFVRDTIIEVFARWGRTVAWPNATTRPLPLNLGPADGPVTPALSPSERERENHCQSPPQPEAPDLVPARPAGLPLPEGEGRGEGEESVVMSEVPHEPIESDSLLTDPMGAAIPNLRL